MTVSSTRQNVDASSSPASVRSRSVIDMAMLYASKAGGIVVGIAILPQFNRLLGPQQFGIVAVVLSFQALLLILDLGMSTLVGRDIAAGDRQSVTELRTWLTGRQVITWVYAGLLPATLLVGGAVQASVATIDLALMLVLFWSLTVQNIGQSALLAKRRYVEAGGIQVAGVLLRGGLTLLAMAWFGATLLIFLCAQTVCSILHMVVTDIRCRHVLHSGDGPAAVGRVACFAMVRRGRSLMLFGLAGAAVMQLDKILVSAFASPAQMAPYYLATTLCLTPIAALAGPVMQYFQPKLIKSLTARDADGTARALRQFATLMALVTILPTAVLWLLREPIIGLWLSHGANVGTVAKYTAILLPGVAVGAFGYVPYVMLVARQDFVFQARISACLTVVTLACVTFAAWKGSIIDVCGIYAAYHSLSTLTSFARCLWLERNEPTHYARKAIYWLVLISAAIAVPLGLAVAGYRLFFI